MRYIETGLTTATHCVSVSKSHPALFSVVLLCVCVDTQAPAVHRLLQADGWGKTSLFLYIVLSSQTAAGSWHSLTDRVLCCPPREPNPTPLQPTGPGRACVWVCVVTDSREVTRDQHVTSQQNREHTHTVYKHEHMLIQLYTVVPYCPPTGNNGM